MPACCYMSTYLGTNNTTAQAWLHNGSVTSTKASAKLLRQLAHTCRHHNAGLTAIHVDGLTNTIAVFLSRSFHLSDHKLLGGPKTNGSNTATLEACDPSGELGLRQKLGTIKQTYRYGISRARAGGDDTAWSTWSNFCHSIYQDPFLQDIVDPMPLLQICAHRYRVGQVAPSGSPVKAQIGPTPTPKTPILFQV
jgi:hypothetical protein